MLSSNTHPDDPFVRIDRLAGLKSASNLLKIGLQERLVYRFNLIVSLFGTIITVLVFRHLWIAPYGAREAYAGVRLDQTITYAALDIVLIQLFPNHLVWLVGARIRTGNVIFDITRPMYYGSLLFFQTVRITLALFLTNSLPALLVTSLLIDLTLPSSGWVWLAFLVCFVLGFLTPFLMDYIAALAGFWITEATGLYNFKGVLISFLGGRYVPLWFFPSVLANIVLLLPFRGINYTPLAILVEVIKLEQVPFALGLQCIWILFLVGLSRFVTTSAVKRLSVQGG